MDKDIAKGKKGNHTGETYTMVWVDEYGEIERTAWNELPEKLKEDCDETSYIDGNREGWWGG